MRPMTLNQPNSDVVLVHGTHAELNAEGRRNAAFRLER